MVSTRQMSTTSSGGSSGTASVTTNSLLEDSNSLRPLVVTRQSNMTSVANNIPTSVATTTLTMITSASSTSATSSSRQTQALKTYGSTSSSTSRSREQKRDINLLDLPEEVLTKILSYLCYKKIAHMRVVSHKMNHICMRILNSTFSKLISKTFNRFQVIKAKMPRRESSRRNHPLAWECDIIETCYMRLSLLQMTFGKHIERGHVCFFPAAILDEVYSILYYIRITRNLDKPYRVTDELFDLSTMAMEYFRDRIEPSLPVISYYRKDFYKLPTTAQKLLSSNLSDIPDAPPRSNMVLRKGIRKIKEGMKNYNNQLVVLRSELRNCKRKLSDHGKQIAEQQKLLAEQRKQTLEYANRLDESDKKNEDLSRKFSTLLQELNKCKTEVQYWCSKTPAIPMCTSYGHNVTPALPSEDYKVVKKNDDDAVSDVSRNDSACNNLSSEFLLTDGTPSTKILTANTNDINLKRPITIMEETESTKTITRSNINLSQNNETDLTEFFDFNKASTSSSPFASTRLYYSSSNSILEETTAKTAVPYKSVIVSPNSQIKSTENNESLKNFEDIKKLLPASSVQSDINSSAYALRNNTEAILSSYNSISLIEDVNNVEVIISPEIKKARRVQKTTRCLNNSSNKRK